MNYHPIDEETARRAHEMMSMRDYKPGSATEEYRDSVDEAAALVARKKQLVSSYYHAKLDALLDTYARRLAEWKNAYNRNGASCPSILVCGAGNFPTRKKAKQNAREDALWQEYKDIDNILHKIASVGTGPVDLADPHAMEMLTDQLNRLQSKLDTGKKMNAHYRKHKTMQGFQGLSDESAARMDAAIAEAPAFAQRPMPDFELTSLRGKIKRVQARIAELEKLKAGDTPEGWKFDGGEVVINTNLNRLQLVFDDRPDDDMRAALKSHGFHWAPSQSAWQRQLTDNAVRAAKMITGGKTQ